SARFRADRACGSGHRRRTAAIQSHRAGTLAACPGASCCPRPPPRRAQAGNWPVRSYRAFVIAAASREDRAARRVSRPAYGLDLIGTRVRLPEQALKTAARATGSLTQRNHHREHSESDAGSAALLAVEWPMRASQESVKWVLAPDPGSGTRGMLVAAHQRSEIFFPRTGTLSPRSTRMADYRVRN